MSVVKMELPSPFPRDEQKASLNPERIRCARETAGLSKVQLAESLGVTSRTVANYEEVGAPVSQAAVLADALQVMPSFFSVSSHAPLIEDLSEGQVWFRSLRKSTVRQRRSAVGMVGMHCCSSNGLRITSGCLNAICPLPIAPECVRTWQRLCCTRFWDMARIRCLR